MRVLSLLLLLLSTGPVLAASCPLTPLALPERSPADGTALAQLVEVTPDGKRATLSGNVLVALPQWLVAADAASMVNDVLELDGTIRARNNALRLRAARAQLNGDVLEAEDVLFSVPNGLGARGSASTLQRSSTALHATQTRYTTCELEGPNAPGWVVEARSIDIDSDTLRGTARNVTLRLRGVPVLWLPIMAFYAGDDRATGFLSPSARYDSDHGLSIKAPWYWNIAPNADATFTAIASQSDAGVDGELRYLSGLGYTTAEANLSGDGHALRLRHQYRNDALAFDFDWATLSDDNHFDTALSAHSLRSADYAPRNASLGYRGERLSATLRWQDDTALGSATKVNYLPSLEIGYRGMFGSRPYRLQTEFARLRTASGVEGRRNVLDFSTSRSKAFGPVTLRYDQRIVANQQDFGDQGESLAVRRFSTLTASGDWTRALPSASITLSPQLQFSDHRGDDDTLYRISDARHAVGYDNFFLANPYIGVDALDNGRYAKFGLRATLTPNDGSYPRVALGLATRQALRDPTINSNGLPDRLLTIDVALSDSARAGYYYQRVSDNSSADSHTVKLTTSNERLQLSGSLTGGAERSTEGALNASVTLSEAWKLTLSHSEDFDIDDKQVDKVGLEFNDCCMSVGTYYRREEKPGDTQWQIGLSVNLRGLGGFNEAISYSDE